MGVLILVSFSCLLVCSHSKDAKVVRIKKTPSYTKFKIRGGKYLYTLKVTNKEQAEKLVKALPAGLSKKEV